MALSTASASSPTIHFSGLPPASGTGRALIHAAARRPASAAPASASASLSHNARGPFCCWTSGKFSIVMPG